RPNEPGGAEEMLRITAAVVLAAVCALGTGTASAKGLDLFPGGTPRAPVSLNPFRVADAQAAPAAHAAPAPATPAAAAAPSPAARRTLTVIVPGLPISWSSQPDAQSFAVWPLFYKSTKFGWAAPLLGSFAIGDPDHGESWGAALFLYWWKRAPQRSLDALFPV